MPKYLCFNTTEKKDKAFVFIYETTKTHVTEESLYPFDDLQHQSELLKIYSLVEIRKSTEF